MVVALDPDTDDVGSFEFSDVFRESLDEMRQKNVTRWALANRDRVSRGTRDALNSVLIEHVSVPGFSEAGVPDAPVIMLIEPFRQAALAIDGVAEAILMVWQESRPELRSLVSSAIATAGADSKSAYDDTFMEELAASLAAERRHYSHGDIRLMLALTQATGAGQTAAVTSISEDGEHEASTNHRGMADLADDTEKEYLREMLETLQRENASLRAANDAAHRELAELKAAAGEATGQDDNGSRTQNSAASTLETEPSAVEEGDSAHAIATRIVGETLAGPPDFGDVASVLEFIEDRWPDRLRLALNATSDPHAYFDQPNQVYGALEWLATTYHDTKTGDTTVTSLDVSLFTTCGWRYRPSQIDAIPGRYKADYQTTDDGRTYSLREHIGRGTGSVEGQIRIAFTWDEERALVIVGYVGRHQRAPHTANTH